MLRSDLTEPPLVLVEVVGDIGLRSSIGSLLSCVRILESFEAVRLCLSPFLWEASTGVERVELLRLPLL
jgi:hypothetical protein